MREERISSLPPKSGPTTNTALLSIIPSSSQKVHSLPRHVRGGGGVDEKKKMGGEDGRRVAEEMFLMPT